MSPTWQRERLRLPSRGRSCGSTATFVVELYRIDGGEPASDPQRARIAAVR
jgi:hypothetical protein